MVELNQQLLVKTEYYRSLRASSPFEEPAKRTARELRLERAASEAKGDERRGEHAGGHWRREVGRRNERAERKRVMQWPGSELKSQTKRNSMQQNSGI